MNSELKKFGFIWAGIFAITAFLPLLKHHEIRYWALYVSISFVGISIIYPQIYQQIRFYQIWIKFGDFIGKINSKIIMAALFYLIFFPIAMVIKILGKDLLNKKIDKSQISYFIEPDKAESNMENQF